VQFLAPIKGLIENQPTAQADPLGAEWLENFIPTERGLRVRGGTTRAAFVTDAMTTMHTLRVATTPQFLATTADAVYNISSLNPTTAPAPIASGMTSGDWSSQQIGTSGGDFLVMCNGSDYTQIFDGTDLNPLAGQAISDLDYDALVTDFEVGETLTGGTSGATATIYGVTRATALTGTLKIGTVTGGPFQNNEALTSASGEAVADGVIAAASALTITGVDTSTLSDVWLYKERLFFVEKDTLVAWYLPAGSVGGAANDISLAGVFRRGGSLLFGTTWASQAGDTLDDYCIFVSTEGEVAVYSGTDPSDAAAWGLQGRYDIGKPLGKRAVVTVGGDALIATDDGIVSLSAAVGKDPARMSLSMVTTPIRESWRQQVNRASSDVELHKWTDENLLLVVFPTASRMFTANLLTGAWATQGGWHGTCLGEYLDDFFVGRTDGRAYKINDGGTDDGEAFTARVCFAFSDMGDPTAYKTISMARASFFVAGGFSYKISIATDYNVTFPPAPDATTDLGDVMVWGTSDWGEAVWGGDEEATRTGRVELWRSVTGAGYSIAPILQITSGAAARVEVELIAVDLIGMTGGRAP
jgi:hypothetical protein